MTAPISCYSVRLMALNQRLHARGIDVSGNVVNVFVRHDDWCTIYLGYDCNCRPDVEIEIDGVMYDEGACPLVANDDGGDHAA